MHTNTTSTNPATSTAPSSEGSAFGNKIKGVVEVVHGAGDSFRGTVMGALDTMTHQVSAKNDEIAQQGRLEMERGFAHIRGSKNQESSFVIGSATATAPSSFSKPSTNAKAATGGEKGDPAYVPGAYGVGAEPPVPIQAEYPQATGGQNAFAGAPATGEETTFPSQQTGPNQIHDVQANYPVQDHTTASEYDPSQAPYRTEVGHPDFSNTKAAAAPNDNKSVGLPPPAVGSLTGSNNMSPANSSFN